MNVTQIGWGYYKQPIKLPLLKVNHVRRFHPDFRTAIYVFPQTKTGILVLALFRHSDAVFTVDKPRTLQIGFKRVQDSIISPRIIGIGIHY